MSLAEPGAFGEIKRIAAESFGPDHPVRRVLEALPDSTTPEQFTHLLPVVVRLLRTRTG